MTTRTLDKPEGGESIILYVGGDGFLVVMTSRRRPVSAAARPCSRPHCTRPAAAALLREFSALLVVLRLEATCTSVSVAVRSVVDTGYLSVHDPASYCGGTGHVQPSAAVDAGATAVVLAVATAAVLAAISGAGPLRRGPAPAPVDEMRRTTSTLSLSQVRCAFFNDRRPPFRIGAATVWHGRGSAPGCLLAACFFRPELSEL